MSQLELMTPAALKPKKEKDPERQRIGRKSRNKGAVGELEVAALLVESGLFPHARRRISGDEARAHERGIDLLDTPGLAVQVRLAKSQTIPETKLAEAIAALPDVHLRDPSAIAVAFTRRFRAEWNVTLRAADFLALLAAAKRGGA